MLRVKSERARLKKKAFNEQRNNAKGRGVPFRLSFEEWCSIWELSGRWKQRGRARGQYVMARFGDKGAYEVGNVQIITTTENRAEVVQTAEGRSRKGCNWSEDKRKAQAERMRKMLAARWVRKSEKTRHVELSKKRWADSSYKARVGAAVSSALTDFWKDPRSDELRDRFSDLAKMQKRDMGRFDKNV